MKRFFKINKDKKLRKKFQKKELLLYFYKSFFYFCKNKNIKLYFYLKIKKLRTKKIQIRNRCVKTGISLYIFRKFKFSRMCLKTYLTLGQITGYKKASW